MIVMTKGEKKKGREDKVSWTKEGSEGMKGR